MLSACRRRCAGLIEYGRVELVHGDAEHTGQPDCSVDVVIAVNNVQIWPDIRSGPKTGFRTRLTALGLPDHRPDIFPALITRLRSASMRCKLTGFLDAAVGRGHAQVPLHCSPFHRSATRRCPVTQHMRCHLARPCRRVPLGDLGQRPTEHVRLQVPSALRRSDGNSGTEWPAGSMLNRPSTSSMYQHRLRSAPLISGTSRAFGPLRREPLPWRTLSVPKPAQLPPHVIQVEHPRLVDPQADICGQASDGVLRAAGANLASSPRHPANSCSTSSTVGGDTQLRVDRGSRPVDLIELALHHTAGEVVQLDLMPQLQNRKYTVSAAALPVRVDGSASRNTLPKSVSASVGYISHSERPNQSRISSRWLVSLRGLCCLSARPRLAPERTPPARRSRSP